MDKKRQTESEPLTPFQDKVDIGLFFSGAQRRKLLEDAKKAVAEGVTVLTITGDEGSGKTMICMMLQKELPEEYACVYLPNNQESFDDVVRVLALGLGTENSAKPESTASLIEEITNNLKESEKKLVAVFDQAERMYIATIERIRKMLDQINCDETLIQVIFAGRKSLLENLHQLKIVDFKETKEREFILNPLGLSETYAYLNYGAQQRSKGRAKNIFTPEAAKKIFSMTKGNLRLTNMLAAKSLEAVDSESSFMILLENVHEQENGEVARSNRQRKYRFPFALNSWTAGAMTGLLILAIFLLFRTGSEIGDSGDPTGQRPDVAMQEKQVWSPPSADEKGKSPPAITTVEENGGEAVPGLSSDFDVKKRDETVGGSGELSADPKGDGGKKDVAVIDGKPEKDELETTSEASIGVSSPPSITEVSSEEGAPTTVIESAPVEIKVITADKKKKKMQLADETLAMEDGETGTEPGTVQPLDIELSSIEAHDEQEAAADAQDKTGIDDAEIVATRDAVPAEGEAGVPDAEIVVEETQSTGAVDGTSTEVVEGVATEVVEGVATELVDGVATELVDGAASMVEEVQTAVADKGVEVAADQPTDVSGTESIVSETEAEEAEAAEVVADPSSANPVVAEVGAETEVVAEESTMDEKSEIAESAVTEKSDTTSVDTVVMEAERDQPTMEPFSSESGSAQVAVSPLSIEEGGESSSYSQEDSEVSSIEPQTAAVVEEVPVAGADQVESGGPEQDRVVDDETVMGDIEPVVIAEIKKRAPARRLVSEEAKKVVKIAPVKIGSPDSNEIVGETEAGMRLYRERLAAGQKWIAEGQKSSHTIQLMALTADQAEENLKKQLETEEYRDVAANLFIIKNSESKVFVYYGEYQDSEEARQARNTLPVFLRKHDPYLLSVNEAVEKAISKSDQN